MYNSALGVIFGVKKYADALWKVVERKGIKVNLHRKLVEIDADRREAIFEVLDSESKPTEEIYEVSRQNLL
jgi:sulfide:quinone oxidoreductase